MTATITTKPFPELARWIPSGTTPELAARIARRALRDVGILEMTPGSNRSGVIDSYMDAVGSPRGMSWCAAALAAWFRESGAEIPPSEAGAVRAWKQWAFATNRWTSHAAIGRAVVYGDSETGTPEHIGVVVRLSPVMLSVEANTSIAGYSTNGIACMCKSVTTSRVLGYINATPLTEGDE